MAPAPDVDSSPSRRRFLSHAVALGGLAAAPSGPWLARLWAQAPACDDGPIGELVGELPLYGVGLTPQPLGEMVGTPGLDARLFTDLSTLTADQLVTPVDRVYVRTSAPPGVRSAPEAWTVALRASATGPTTAVSTRDLVAEARPMGTHVMECAGNANPQNFGLMSAVEWDGVALDRVLERLPRPKDAAAVLISGLDHESALSPQSLPGASWIVPLDAIARTAPFLAVRMNGSPLSADHGAPVRLVVPGWYGCAWIKWVNDIRWVGADEPATTQMLEFAFRTHQEGIPALARDYAEPVIDAAAMPVRIEQRRVAGRLEYRVVGIVWGGSRPVDRLIIRFGGRDPGTAFAICPAPRTHQTWSLWTYRWRPAEPGYYDISLRVADPAVRTRRLDLSFYIRRVRIDEILTPPLPMRLSPVVPVIVVCLLHPGASSVKAQSAHDAQLWAQALAVGRIGDWRTHVEIQPRVFDDVSELGLVINRVAIGRAIDPRVSAWLGYAWVPRPFGPGIRHEQRIWQQLLVTPPAMGSWTPTLRLRLEQRWQNAPWDGSSHRLRTLVRAQKPIDAARRWQVASYNELMVTFDKTPSGPRQGYDRNRFYAGILRAIAPALTVEGGYIWEHSPLTGPGDRHDHAAIGVVTVQWPRR